MEWAWQKIFSLNIRAIHILHDALNENDYVKISKCSNAKDILNTIDSIYLTNQSYEIVDGVHRENEEKCEENQPTSSNESSDDNIRLMVQHENREVSSQTFDGLKDNFSFEDLQYTFDELALILKN